MSNMNEMTDETGTVFDPAVHLLTEDGPFLTSTGKFRKLREGAANNRDLVAKFFGDQTKQEDEIVTDTPAPAPVIPPANGVDAEALAKEFGARLEKKPHGFTFHKGNRHVSFNASNYTTQNSLRSMLMKFGFSA